MKWITWFCLIILSGLVGCTAESPPSVIQLSALQPVPEAPVTAVTPLRVAVAAIISPQGTADSYAPMLDYLGAALNRPVQLVQRRTYAEVNELVQNGEVDLAFVCTSAYVVGVRDFGMQLLAAPQVQGETVYHSLLIVPATSNAQNMSDLRGKVFAFTDPISTTGRNYPISLVQQLGQSPETFFGRTFYTYSHDDAIRAVATGVADGAAVDSLVYMFAVQREPELAAQTRIIHQSPAFGMPPVVTGPDARPQLVADLQSILLHMHEDANGRAALQQAGFEQFVPIDDAAYDTVRHLELRVNDQP
jgi:phosphonate transport system substrate-binding protein